MKKILLLLGAFFFWGTTNAQVTILDFETPTTTANFQYFGSSLEPGLTSVIANPDMSGINTSAMVSDFTKPSGAQTWAGGFADPTTAIDLTTDTDICVKVWMPEAGNLALKLEMGNQGDWIKTIAVTDPMQWVEICYNTLAASDESATVAAGGIYNRLVLFYDFGTAPTVDKTMYFDDLVIQASSGPTPGNVTFDVDMNDNMSGFTTVYISGDFNGWSGTGNAMSDPDGDGVWSITLPLTGGPIEYKFTTDDWADQEIFAGGESCTVTNGGFTNRSYLVDGDATVGPVCWNSCDACMDDVTFHVDMNQYGGTFTEVQLNGSFNGWCGDCNPMSDPDGDGVWSVTIPLFPGDIEYKFTYDAWTGQENFLGGESCTVTNGGFTNRFYTVDGDADLGVVCYNSCVDCASTPNPGDITFHVDMNQYGGTFTEVQLNGSFNGWCGDCNPMSDPDGDGVWSITLPLAGGDIEYKFTYDAWTGQENFAGGESCTVTNGAFTNRFHSVDGNADLGVVCWDSCDACPAPCSAPENVGHSLGNPASCTITWDEHPSALRYDVIYRVQGTSTWTRTGALNAYKTLHNLAPNTWYQYRVRSYCGTWDFANATGFRYFNTGNTPQVREGFSNYATEIIDMYPNPASEVLNVEFSTSTLSDVNLYIMDMTGRTIAEQTIANVEGFQRESIDISNLGEGYYMVVLVSGDQKMVKKFAKIQ